MSTPRTAAPPPVTAHDRVRIAAVACVSPETVLRAYAGAPIRSTCAARIVRAAQDLGLPPPAVVLAP